MSDRSNKPEKDFVTAVLSCSVRPEDWPLIDAIEGKVLSRLGFRCMTVGRNISLPDQADDAIRDIIDRVDCLIGIATVRLEAAERSLPNRTLGLASPYILQESAMAHQRRIPFLILKTPEVTLLGVTARNLYLEVSPDMPHGRPVFLSRQDVALSALEELKKRAMENRKQRSPSGVTSKPAIRGHFKTGHRRPAQNTLMLYPAGDGSGKLFSSQHFPGQA